MNRREFIKKARKATLGLIGLVMSCDTNNLYQKTELSDF